MNKKCINEKNEIHIELLETKPKRYNAKCIVCGDKILPFSVPLQLLMMGIVEFEHKYQNKLKGVHIIIDNEVDNPDDKYGLSNSNTD